MQKIATYSYRVQPLDVDFSDKVRLAQLLGYLLHAAGMNARENGFGTEALLEKDRAWVASRLAMEVLHYPKAHEGFQIETWVEDFGHVFTTRNFKLYCEDGTPMGAGSSVWCMIDLSARKAVDLGEVDYSAFVTGIPSSIDKPMRIPATGEPVSRHRVKYSDLDFTDIPIASNTWNGWLICFHWTCLCTRKYTGLTSILSMRQCMGKRWKSCVGR